MTNVTDDTTRTCKIPAGKTTATASNSFKFVIMPSSSKGLVPGWANVPRPSIRCDRATYIAKKPGCVFTANQPTFHLSLKDAKVKHTAAHVKSAQAKLKDHWGSKARHGKVLSRKYWGKATNKNRSVACKGFKKKSRTDSCDEYPFASTYQGAYYVSKARTSIAHVPLKDNTTAGSRLGAFYAANRILDKDKFWVTAS